MALAKEQEREGMSLYPETKTLKVAGEVYQFDSIDLLEAPYWIVNLTDGGVLILDFSQTKDNGG